MFLLDGKITTYEDIRLFHDGHYVVFAFFGSREERFPYYYILVFSEAEMKFQRYLRHNLSWKRTTRPEDFLFMVDRDELWGYKGVKGKVEMFRVDPTRQAVAPVCGGKTLNLPKYTMTGTPLARGVKVCVPLSTLLTITPHVFQPRAEVQIVVRDWRKEVKGEFSVMFEIPKPVLDSRRGLDLGQVRCCLSGPKRRIVVFCCHYCDPVAADGFSLVAIDLDGGCLTEMGAEHFHEGVAGQMSMAGGRLLLIERRSRSNEFLKLVCLDIFNKEKFVLAKHKDKVDHDDDVGVRMRSGEYDCILEDENVSNPAYVIRGHKKKDHVNKFILTSIDLLTMV